MSTRASLVAIAREREPRLLLSAQLISMLGDGVAMIALPLYVLDMRHSATALTWLAVARMAPMVGFVLFGGVIVDRVSRRTLLFASDSGRALAMGILAFLLATHHLPYGILLVNAFFFGVADSVAVPAFTALIPEVTTADLLMSMNAGRSLTNNIMGRLVGPALGGLLATVSTSLAFAFDALTFVGSAALIVAMRPTPTPSREKEASMMAQMREGFAFVASAPWFWWTLVAVTLSNAFLYTQSSVASQILLRGQFHISKSVFGLVVSLNGVVGIVSSLVASVMKPIRRRYRTMLAIFLVSDLAMFGFAFGHNVPTIVLTSVATTPLFVLGGVLWESLMQTEVPSELMGRASAVDWFFSLALSPIGLAISGPLMDRYGVHAYYAYATAIAAIPGLCALLSRRGAAIDAGR